MVLMIYRMLLYVSVVLFAACTPKTTEPVSQQPDAPEQGPAPKPGEVLSPCPKFSDTPDPDGTIEKYVLYRDFLKNGEWNKAYTYWQEVHKLAPAADGKRNSVLADGIVFMEYFYSQTEDEAQKKVYVDRIFELYDQIQQCYPEGGYVAGRKAFDLYYKYPERTSKEEIYRLFRKSVDTDGMDTRDFVLNPFTALLVELYFEDKVSMEEARKYEEKIRAVLAKGLKECKGAECERWNIVEEYVPSRLQAFEAVKGFYDCAYYMERYYPEFLADTANCDVLRTVYSRLAWGECSKEEPRFARLIRAGNAQCAPAGTNVARAAYDCLQEADYDCAIQKFEQAAEETDDQEKKGSYLLLVAKIYQTHKINFPKSREYALKAAEARPNWGEPYIHIGRLYASSGPLCGPGRGWDSQVVVWPAIDMWVKAREVDPSSAAEANKWIGRYSQYMPKKEDVFQRLKKVGESYFVPCWIQRSTIIRTSD